MPVNESTQTNGVPAKKELNAGMLNGADASQEHWTVESERLKTTKRAGWRRFGIDHAESIADHMYRMSILTMAAPASVTDNIKIATCTRMALIHDMAESLVGDITPVDNVAKEEKSRRESETMDYICNKLLGKFNGGINGEEIRKLWQEYEDNETKESMFVHDIDKIELLLQMLEYERSHPPSVDLGEFTWVAVKIQSPEIRTWAQHVFWERAQLWKSRGVEPKWNIGDMRIERPAS